MWRRKKSTLITAAGNNVSQTVGQAGGRAGNTRTAGKACSTRDSRNVEFVDGKGLPHIDVGKTEAKEVPSSEAATIAGGQKKRDWIEAKQKLWTAVQEVNAVAQKTADGFVCIPLKEYEALQAKEYETLHGKHRAAATHFPILRQLPQYPGVKGNFDGLWRLWLQQELRYRRISPQLAASMPFADVHGGKHTPDPLAPLSEANPPSRVYPPLPSSATYFSEQPWTYRVLLRHEEKTQQNIKEIQPSAESVGEIPVDGRAFLYDVVRVQKGNTNRTGFRTEVASPAENGDREGFEQWTKTDGIADELRSESSGEYPTLLNNRRAAFSPAHHVDHEWTASAGTTDQSLPNYPFTQPEPVPPAFDVFWQQARRNASQYR